ncbi:MAG: hypothetical protein FJ290_28385 [Planctomycetes bacterium]|nr:hypothetical protein [Planctomycetota bacterium]
MIPTLDAPAPVPLDALPAAAPAAVPVEGGPVAAVVEVKLPTDARLLAAWARERCPHLKPDGKCRRARGGCALLGLPPRRCQWAEQGPAVAAPEPVYRAYLAMAGGPWWAGRRRAAAAIGRPRAAAGRLCKCGRSLAPRRRMCDRCRAAARRHTNTESQKRWRAKLAGVEQLAP